MKNFYLDEKNANDLLIMVRYEHKVMKSSLPLLRRILTKMILEDHLLPEEGDIIHVSGVNENGEEISRSFRQIENARFGVKFYDVKNVCSSDLERYSYYINLMFSEV